MGIDDKEWTEKNAREAVGTLLELTPPNRPPPSDEEIKVLRRLIEACRVLDHPDVTAYLSLVERLIDGNKYIEMQNFINLHFKVAEVYQEMCVKERKD